MPPTSVSPRKLNLFFFKPQARTPLTLHPHSQITTPSTSGCRCHAGSDGSGAAGGHRAPAGTAARASGTSGTASPRTPTRARAGLRVATTTPAGPVSSQKTHREGLWSTLGCMVGSAPGGIEPPWIRGSATACPTCSRVWFSRWNGVGWGFPPGIRVPENFQESHLIPDGFFPLKWDLGGIGWVFLLKLNWCSRKLLGITPCS